MAAAALSDFAEGNASDWGTFASDGRGVSVANDSGMVKVGSQSIKFVTASGFDTGVTYPKLGQAHIDASAQTHLSFWIYGLNSNLYGFQGNQPKVVVKCAGGNFTYTPLRQETFNGSWNKIVVPLAGDANWVRTQTGTPLVSDVLQIEIHNDTWDYGFTLYLDGLSFLNPDAPPTSTLPTPPPPAGVDANVIKPRVLLYCFDPIMENKGGARLHDSYFGFQDPVALTQQIVQNLRNDSHDRVQYQVVETKIVDAHPYFSDGFQHTDASFNTAWNARNFRSGTFDYARFVRENNLTPRIESGDLDEVWIYAGPISGLYESAMGGQGAYWINGIANNVTSNRAFVMMGWNFERGLGEAIHSYGHRAESIMVHSYGEWLANQSNNWNKFTLLDKQIAGLGGVGNVHFPFNGLTDYDYANTRIVPSNADDWASYPAFAGLSRSFGKGEWSPANADPQREYLDWWYSHPPTAPGMGLDGFLNNWWRYIADVDQFKGGNSNLALAANEPSVNISSPAHLGAVSGMVKVKANAVCDGALGRVDFYVDGTYRVTDYSAHTPSIGTPPGWRASTKSRPERLNSGLVARRHLRL